MFCRSLLCVVFLCSCSGASGEIRRLDATEATKRIASSLFVEIQELVRRGVPVESRDRCVPDSADFEHLLEALADADNSAIRSVEVFEKKADVRLFDIVVVSDSRQIKILVEEKAGLCEKYEVRQIVD